MTRMGSPTWGARRPSRLRLPWAKPSTTAPAAKLRPRPGRPRRCRPPWRAARCTARQMSSASGRDCDSPRCRPQRGGLRPRRCGELSGALPAWWRCALLLSRAVRVRACTLRHSNATGEACPLSGMPAFVGIKKANLECVFLSACAAEPGSLVGASSW